MEHRQPLAPPVQEWIARGSLDCGLFPREEAARINSDAWSVFAIHGNYVRPTRDQEWYHGEPCRLRSSANGNMFELPPGSVPYSVNAIGSSAHSWEPFVFPNPSRQFIMSQQHANTSLLHNYMRGTQGGRRPDVRGIVGIGLRGSPDFWRNGKLTYFRRRVAPIETRTASIPPIELDDLERQLWFDPEPRFEKPFKTYADTKYCTKGPGSISAPTMMRTGW